LWCEPLGTTYPDGQGIGTCRGVDFHEWPWETLGSPYSGLGGLRSHSLPDMRLASPKPALLVVATRCATQSNSNLGVTEPYCGDLAPHVEAGCVYPVPADGHIPPLVTPWPSAQRRISPPGASADAQGRLAPRPGALFMCTPTPMIDGHVPAIVWPCSRPFLRCMSRPPIRSDPSCGARRGDSGRGERLCQFVLAGRQSAV
jgi:hypothetical protein